MNQRKNVQKQAMLTLVDKFQASIGSFFIAVMLKSKHKSMEETIMNLSEKLIGLRKEKGWSQEELGENLDVTRQTVSKWELGQTTPEMNKLIEMSRLFGISIDELVGNSYEKETVVSDKVLILKPKFEYKSEKTLFGVPLVHINIGFGFRKARGIIAIGNISSGIISVGICSAGVISLGVFSLGLLSLGALALGLISIGGLSVGALAFGGLAIGLISVGGLSIGAFSVGGFAKASEIALGGYANGHIAIGDVAKGDFAFSNFNELKASDFENIRSVILTEYPNFPQKILDLFLI